MKLSFFAVIVLLYCFGCPNPAAATVFRDRNSFNAASQNLNTVDFESLPPDLVIRSPIDGLTFNSINGPPSIVAGANGNMLYGASVGEITFVTIHLPPGTTAVGCDQFAAPMIVSISGESVTMNASDGSTFVGFVSEQPIQTLTISFDFPEPTPSALIDNISFGQRRSANGLPVPQLLTSATNARAAALDSVTKASEPFQVPSSLNFSTDGRTRITLFLVGVALESTDAPFVTVQAEDAQHNVFSLPVEATARVKNLSWMSQVTVRLPDALSGAGNVDMSVSVRGVVSNKAPLRID